MISELPLHEHLRDTLDEFCRTKEIPNILFHGASGCGKKTIVFNFVARIYNNDIQRIQENVLYINCSQGKGIKYIREELKTFAKYNIHVSFDLPFKTIIMLNFDNLSIDAQSVMRRIIELFINTRFFIIVENKYKLLNPIISRFCSLYIPEHMIDSRIINLHHYHIQCAGNDTTYTHPSLDTFLDMLAHDRDTLCLTDECIQMYEAGISCHDLIHRIETYEHLSPKDRSSLLMKYYIFKKEYRCEKLLMFHIVTCIQNMMEKSLQGVC